MALKTSLTGSYPPIFDPQKGIRNLSEEDQEKTIQQSIERAITHQIEMGIDILVDGQIRDDIITLYTTKFRGYDPSAIPFRITGKIRPSPAPITVGDYLFAKKLAGPHPLKAHITGPITLARASRIDPSTNYRDRNDPKLILDLAEALCAEAEALVNAGAEIIQIDEPALADGVDLDLAFQGIEYITQNAKIPFPALHICGNVTHILESILNKCTVRMISIEGAWLNQESLQKIDAAYLSVCGKQIGLGCIQVVDHRIDHQRAVQDFLDALLLRLGEENIWAAMPNCGLRTMPVEVAKKKIEVMVKAAQAIKPVESGAYPGD
jgi:5-methyltetrahydropteroyltriglutamate--homocysteine methyltransferase